MMGAVPKLPWWFDYVLPIALPFEVLVINPLRWVWGSDGM